MTHEHRIITEEVARAVAKELDGDSIEKTHPNQDGCYIIRLKEPHGAGILLESGHYHNNNRLCIEPMWPRYKLWREVRPMPHAVFPSDLSWKDRKPSPAITLSLDKTPTQLAADIKRRFLPEYLRLFALCRAEATRREARDELHQNCVSRLLELTGGTYYRLDRASEKIRFKGGVITYIGIDGDEPPRVTVQLDDVSEVKLRKLMEVLR